MPTRPFAFSNADVLDLVSLVVKALSGAGPLLRLAVEPSFTTMPTRGFRERDSSVEP